MPTLRRAWGLLLVRPPSLGRGRQAGGLLGVRFAWRRFNAGLLHEVPAVEGTEPRIVLVSDMSNAHASRLALFVTGGVVCQATFIGYDDDDSRVMVWS